MTHLALSFLGPLQITLDGEPLTAFESNKIRALLIYLAVEADRPHPRETLAGLLWPDWPNRAALANLRHALARLRRLLRDADAPIPFLLIDRDTIQLNERSDYALDVARFQGFIGPQAGTDELAQAVTLYRGPFLEGFVLADCPALEEWITCWREGLQEGLLGALVRLVGCYVARGEGEAAHRAARRALSVDPLREEAHRELMRALALSGQRSAALAQYERCRELLREELGVEPARETTALAAMIRQETLPGPQGGLTVALPAPVTLPGEGTEVVAPEAPPPLFVAREGELAHLDRWLEEALAGRGRVGFVVGEAGSGKTMLLAEFARRAMQAHPELVVASGSCNAYAGLGDPYLPFVEVLGLLTADVEARLAAGGMGHEQARRLQALFPAAVEALSTAALTLLDVLLPSARLLARAQSLAPHGAPWRAQLEEAVARHASMPPLAAPSDLFQQVTRFLQGLAGGRPLLLWLDDLQWADAGSIAMLFHLGRRLAGCRILVLGAYRPEEVAGEHEGQRHPLEPVVAEFRRSWRDLDLDLAQAEGRAFIDALVDAEPNDLGPGFREALYAHTGGHALFTTELLRGLQQRGDLRRDDQGCWVERPGLDWATLPAGLEAVIAAHIGRLPGEWQELLAVASVEGDEFTAEVVARVLGREVREVLSVLSGPLCREQHLVAATRRQRQREQPRSQYRFRHILFQRYLYAQLDTVRRAQLHEAVGRTLEALYVATAYSPLSGIGLPSVAEWIDGTWDLYAAQLPPEDEALAAQLARHFDAAGLVEKAVGYLFQMDMQVGTYLSHEDAVAAVERALALLATLPASPQRTFAELTLYVCRGADAAGSRGWLDPVVIESKERADELACVVGDTPLRCVTLILLAEDVRQHGQLARARALAEKMVQLSVAEDLPVRLLAHGDLSQTLLLRGEFAAARAHLEATYAPALASPPQPLRMLYNWHLNHVGHAPWALWCLGYPEQAATVSRATPALGQNWPTPAGMIQPLCDAICFFHQLSRDLPAMEVALTELERLDREGWCVPVMQPFVALYRGWVQVQRGALAEGIETLRRGLAGWSANFVVLRPYWKGHLAEALARAGQVEEGLALLDEALAQCAETGEGFAEAELHRLQGELRRQRGDDPDEVEGCFRQAVTIAQRQEARSWELRATVSLARLLRDQGRTSEAREQLAAIYGWFTEGFDTPDLVEAHRLLDELEKTR